MFTIELHCKQVVAKFFCFPSTAADEARKIVFPIPPVDLLAAIIGDGLVALVVNVVWKCTPMAFVLEAAQRLE